MPDRIASPGRSGTHNTYTEKHMEFKNYRTIFEKDVKDLDCRAHLLRHEKTGARVTIRFSTVFE